MILTFHTPIAPPSSSRSRHAIIGLQIFSFFCLKDPESASRTPGVVLSRVRLSFSVGPPRRAGKLGYRRLFPLSRNKNLRLPDIGYCLTFVFVPAARCEEHQREVFFSSLWCLSFLRVFSHMDKTPLTNNPTCSGDLSPCFPHLSPFCH